MSTPHDNDAQSVLSGMVSDWLDGDLGTDAMHSFSEVNRRGLEAATTIITRMTDLIDGVAGPRESPTGATGADGDSIAQLRGEIMKSIDTWAEVMGTLVETSLDVLHRAGSAAPTEAARNVVVGPLQPGDEASRPIYAHASHGQGLIRCRVGTFESARGHALPAGAVTVDPDVLIEGGGDHLTLNVGVPADAISGRYRGYVFADGVTETAVAIEIVVAASS